MTMLAIAKTVIARPRTKHEKILIQKIKEEGSIPAFLELYDGMWTVDPNYTIIWVDGKPYGCSPIEPNV